MYCRTNCRSGEPSGDGRKSTCRLRPSDFATSSSHTNRFGKRLNSTYSPSRRSFLLKNCASIVLATRTPLPSAVSARISAINSFFDHVERSGSPSLTALPFSTVAEDRMGIGNTTSCASFSSNAGASATSRFSFTTASSSSSPSSILIVPSLSKTVRRTTVFDSEDTRRRSCNRPSSPNTK